MFATIAYAKSFDQLVNSINRTILNPLIQFAFIIAFVFFVWGVIEYIKNADNAEARKKGHDHMIWGIIGLAIMVGVYGIMSLLINSFGLSSNYKLDSKEQTFNPPCIKDLKINGESAGSIYPCK